MENETIEKQTEEVIETQSDNFDETTKDWSLEVKGTGEGGYQKAKTFVEQNSADKFIDFKITSDYVADSGAKYKKDEIIKLRKTHLQVEASGLKVSLEQGGSDTIPWENFTKA